MRRENVGEVVRGRTMEDFVSLLELRLHCSSYGEPLKDFKQEFHDHICVSERL